MASSRATPANSPLRRLTTFSTRRRSTITSPGDDTNTLNVCMAPVPIRADPDRHEAPSLRRLRLAKPLLRLGEPSCLFRRESSFRLQLFQISDHVCKPFGRMIAVDRKIVIVFDSVLSPLLIRGIDGHKTFYNSKRRAVVL